MEFEGEDWLVDIYLDEHDRICIMKSTQCGISEFAIVVALTECLKGYHVLYVLPSKVFVTDFVSKRIDGLTERVPQYKGAIGTTNNKGLKAIWDGWLKVIGSNVRSALLSDPAQIAIVDEVDVCDQKNLGLVDRRMDAAKKLTGREPTKILISNPSAIDHGIHKAYNDSDKRVWTLTCSHCGEEQELDFFRHYVEETEKGKYQLRDKKWTEDSDRDIRGYCLNCSKPIDRFAPGQWIAEFPGKRYHGYKISQLFTRQTTIRDIWHLYLDALEDPVLLPDFYNMILGMPFESSDYGFTPTLLKKCSDPEYVMPEGITEGISVAGVDIGKNVHLKISQIVKGVRMTVCIASFKMTYGLEDLSHYLKLFKVKACVIDAQPETTIARNFQKTHRRYGVFLCRFTRGVSIKEAFPDPKTGEIQIDRTQAFDSDFFHHVNGKAVLPANYKTIDRGDYFRQMQINKRVTEIDSRGNRVALWKKGKEAADHYQLASVYEWIAARKIYRGGMEIKWI